MNKSVIKRIIYKISRSALRLIWSLKGFRKLRCFGYDLRVSAKTEFPSYWKLQLPRGDSKSKIVRYGDYVQLHSISNYLSSLKHPATVVEIGAHHGAYAVIIGKILKMNKGKLIAVEPNEESFQILKQNIRLNDLEDIVFCEQIAISDKEGTINLAPQGSQSRIINTRESGSIIVRSVTMESLLRQYAITEVDLLLIDVEGAELPILKGFPWQSVSVGKIFCELHPYAWKDFNYNGMDMKRFLSDHTFRCVDMYLQEHTDFPGVSYIGPTVFMSDEQ